MPMSRFIVIGDADYQITIGADGRPSGGSPGGTLLNLAAELARRGNSVEMVSEVGNDPLGTVITGWLESNGVSTRSIDRSVTSATPATIVFGGEYRTTMRYLHSEPDSVGLDVIWPEISNTDTIIFGGFLAVSPRCRSSLLDLLRYTADRKARIIYFPGFDPSRISRITKVMPQIFENLELTQAVLTRTRDISYIFGTSDPETAYRNHLSFYVDSYRNVDSDSVSDIAASLIDFINEIK